MSAAHLPEIATLLTEKQSFIIAAHARPDGDALGSSLALGLSLLEAGKDVQIINEDLPPRSLQKLPGIEKLQLASELSSEKLGSDSVFLALDNATQERLGESTAALSQSSSTLVNIDHHISNQEYGDLFYIGEQAAATGEIIYDLLVLAELSLSLPILENLYVAISTDTGSFRYPNTTARTHQIIAHLLEGGVNGARLASELYESYSPARLELRRTLMESIQLDPLPRTAGGGQIATWTLSLEQAQQINAEGGDSEGLIDTLREIDEVKAAVYFEEMENGKIRVSARSKEGDGNNKGIDVCAACAAFGGGGHKLAAGVRMTLPLEESRNVFIQEIISQVS